MTRGSRQLVVMGSDLTAKASFDALPIGACIL